VFYISFAKKKYVFSKYQPRKKNWIAGKLPEYFS